jgi:hypothetical protein
MATDQTTPGRPREWDAAGYDALPLPHERWGRRLLSTVPLTGDETVLDVGAGTGRDTAALLGRLPRGHEAALTATGLPPLNAACNFAADGETAARLRDAGFTDVETALVPDPARFEPGAQLEAYLGTVVLGSVLESVPPGGRAEAVRQVAARLPEPTVDYVRLQASARRPSGPR